MFGLAGRRRQLCIETRAPNAMTRLVSRCEQAQPQGRVIAPGAPISRRAMRRSCACSRGAARGRFPARLSRDAGRYLCNYVYWQALRQTANARPLVQFIHIPLQRRREPGTVRRQELGCNSASFGAAHPYHRKRSIASISRASAHIRRQPKSHRSPAPRRPRSRSSCASTGSHEGRQRRALGLAPAAGSARSSPP